MAVETADNRSFDKNDAAVRGVWPFDPGLFDALLFDLDGTLVDTMPLHYRAYAHVFARRGYHLSEAAYFAAIGGPAREVIPVLCDSLGMRNISGEEIVLIHSEKKEVFARTLGNYPPTALPAANLLRCACGLMRLALVSSGNREGTEATIAAMGWSKVFDCVITGDDVINGKPHPEPYLTAADRLCVSPHRCLVLEDTSVGIEAGIAAGMTVIDVLEPWPFRQVNSAR